MKEGWTLKTLGDVCTSKSSNVSQNKLADEDGDFPIYGASGLIKKVSFYHRDKPYLSIVKDGSGFGRVTKVGAFTSVIGTLQYILPKEDVDIDYLNYALMSVDFKKYVAGAAIPHIYFKDYKNEPFLWVPLPEQQRIVSIIDKAFEAIDKAIENTQKNLQNAKELFESYLNNVFENGGEGWTRSSLEDVVDEDCKLSYGIVQPGEDFVNGLPVVRPTDLINKIVNLSTLKRIDPSLSEGYKRTKLVGDEILICVRGNTGIISIVTTELKNANVTRGIVPIRFNPKLINQEFGYYMLKSVYVQKQIRTKTYGAALMQINIGDLRKIKTVYNNLDEQLTMVKKLDSLSINSETLQSNYQQKLRDLDELKKSILNRAFAGEL
jgi:type I restriction enzyme S subunit